MYERAQGADVTLLIGFSEETTVTRKPMKIPDVEYDAPPGAPSVAGRCYVFNTIPGSVFYALFSSAFRWFYKEVLVP